MVRAEGRDINAMEVTFFLYRGRTVFFVNVREFPTKAFKSGPMRC
jgi:hypothetical protein